MTEPIRTSITPVLTRRWLEPALLGRSTLRAARRLPGAAAPRWRPTRTS